MSSILKYFVCLIILLTILSCNQNGVSTSGSQNLALGFVEALQEENFQTIWNSYLPYQERVAKIQDSSPKQSWKSMEQKEFEKEKEKQYPNGEWARWSSYLKNASFELMEVRPVENEQGVAFVFVQVTYLNRTDSPFVRDILVEKMVLRIKTVRNGRTISSIDQHPASDIPWPDDEATRIEIAKRYYRSGKNIDALNILQSPVTLEGRELRANILYSQYAQEALRRPVSIGSLGNESSINRAIQGMKEALLLNPALKSQFHTHSISLFNQYESSDKWWIKQNAYPLLVRLAVFFPEDIFIRGKIVQYALLDAENALCWEHHPNVTEIHGGRRNIPQAIDLAKKYGGNSALTQKVINKLISTYNNPQTRDEYVKKCDQRYRRGPLYSELKQKDPKEFVTTKKKDNSSIEETTSP